MRRREDEIYHDGGFVLIIFIGGIYSKYRTVYLQDTTISKGRVLYNRKFS